jgi:hypothetical protein
LSADLLLRKMEYASWEERGVGDETGRERVRVVDRRWFTSEGELREPLPESPEEVALPEPEPEPEPTQADTHEIESPSADVEAGSSTPDEPAAKPEKPPTVSLPSRALLDIVDFLAQYAMAFLTGQVPGVARDPEAARLFIELLTTVQERTSGRASLQEAKVLEDVLYQLRLQYMATSR